MPEPHPRHNEPHFLVGGPIECLSEHYRWFFCAVPLGAVGLGISFWFASLPGARLSHVHKLQLPLTAY